jgi:NAD(P)-dependent dehydrogenase (short-subunit alcohol dehydrogenase family)
MHTRHLSAAREGLGQLIAKRLADRGDDVVITSRDLGTRRGSSREDRGHARGFAVDLSEPARIADAFASVGQVDNLVVTGIEQGPTRSRTSLSRQPRGC